MNQFGDAVYVAAAVVAVSALLMPLAGRYVLEMGGYVASQARPAVRPGIVLVLISAVIAAVLLAVCSWTRSPSDLALLLVVSAAFGLGLGGDRFRLSRAARGWLQVALAVAAPLLGASIPVTDGSAPLIDAACTSLFVLGVLNALAIVNFLDGFASLIVFMAAACIAALIAVATGLREPVDASAAVFALAICGGSLGFFVFRRPRSRSYMSDLGALTLEYALALLAVRVWNIEGLVVLPPQVFMPLSLILPILAVGIHREHMALFRRQRLALILIVTGQLPAWAPVTLAPVDLQLPAAGLAIATAIAWTAMVTQGRALRGWSMRVMAEPIADVLRAGIAITVVAGLFGLLIDPIVVQYTLIASALTAALLILQIVWWRKRAHLHRLPEVVVFGNQEDYHQARFIVNNCTDIIGRQSIVRSPISPVGKKAVDAVAKELCEGRTVLILDDSARSSLIGLRALGDLVFSGDCLLLGHVDERLSTNRMFRLVDVLQDYSHRAVALLALIALAPVFIAVAVLIKLDDGGPVFFKQRRLGYRGRRFLLYKFRSMRVDAPKYGESPRTKVDPRITRVGRVIRKLSIDELPQLINVVQGDMRLVGPRPEMPFICSRYSTYQRLRLDVPPGVTGLWQISPHRNDPIHDHIEYDLAYRQSRGPILDAAIIIGTILGGVKTGY